MSSDVTVRSVSVVVPTYNRHAALLRCLEALAGQRWPTDQLEVIVVDDGSVDETPSIAQLAPPWRLRYLRQPNSGDAVARNTGALASEADLLVFLDDDIVVEPDYVEAHAALHQAGERRIGIAHLESVVAPEMAVIAAEDAPIGGCPGECPCQIPFTWCLSGAMSVRRLDFLSLGMMQPVTPTGSSLWCDVDFGWRAQLAGFTFWLTPAARARHEDATMADIETSLARSHRAARSAAELFSRHPELAGHLPMFDDKLPLDWKADSPALMARKLIRRAASSGPAVWGMRLGLDMSAWAPPRWSAPMRRVLFRWITGAHLYAGLHDGMAGRAATRPGPWGKLP